MPDQPRPWTVNALAAEFGLNHRTVAKRLVRVPPAAVSGHGTPLYLIQDVAALLVSGHDGRRGSMQLEEARLRKTAAEARLAELELGRQSAEVIAVVDADELVGGHYAAVRQRLRAIPARLAGQLAVPEPAAARHVLQQAIEEVLAELETAS